MDSEGAPTTPHIAGRAATDAKGAGRRRRGVRLPCRGTSLGFVKAWDISRREPRQHAAGRKLGEASRVSHVSIAADGSRLAATLEEASSAADGKAAGAGWERSASLHVYFVESDALQTHDFGPSGRLPTATFFEPSDCKLSPWRRGRAAAAAAAATSSRCGR